MTTKKINDKEWLIPHQVVTHPNKVGKMRVVFDCSVEYSDRCINKELLKGPDLTNHIVSTLLRFREEFVTVMADIKMFF